MMRHEYQPLVDRDRDNQLVGSQVDGDIHLGDTHPAGRRHATAGIHQVEGNHLEVGTHQVRPGTLVQEDMHPVE